PSAVRRSVTVMTSPGSSSIKSMRELILHLGRGGGNPDHEFRTLHGFAADRDRAAVGLPDALDQIEAETGAADLVLDCAAAAEEGVEQALLFVQRDARAVIGHADFDGGAGSGGHGSGENTDPVAPLRAVFERVVDQIL